MGANNEELIFAEIRKKLELSDDQLLVELGQSLGKGATFTIQLPVANPSAASVTRASQR